MNIKKIVTLSAAWIFALLTAFAVPAMRVVKTVTQPDGTKVQIVLTGDEHCHYYTTTDGLMVSDGTDGKGVRYSTFADGGDRVDISPVLAHNPGSRGAAEMAHISAINIAGQDNIVSVMRSKSRAARAQASRFPNTGTVRGLIILAEYQDVRFSSRNVKADFTRQMNEEGFADNGATGSARDYFIAQSHGKFTPEFDVVGPVLLPHDMKFYGENQTARGDDKDAAQMIVDACQGLKDEIDFSQYDFDGDGEVDLVFVIYAGYAEAQGGGGDTVWPHAWDIKSAGKQLRLNGKNIGRYACTAELRGNTGAEPDGIGTFCHEFTHCLGLPDIYDSRYSGLVGMGAWSLMDQGSYNNLSRTPCGMSAYERSFIGWLDIKELKAPAANLTLRHIENHDEAYKIVAAGNPNEYYTLENRQQEGWDKYLPGHGMMIVHVDYNEQVWAENIVNSAASGHAHLQIVPANNQLSMLEGAAWPGTAGARDFADWTAPAAKLYSGGTLGHPVTNIREEDGVVTFNYDTYLAAPYIYSAADITDNSFTASWDAVERAEKYTVCVASPVSGKEIVAEDFAKFTYPGLTQNGDGETGSDTGVPTDIGLLLDNFTAVAGWSGTDVYATDGTCVLGQGTTGGTLAMPLQQFEEHHTFTLHVRCKAGKTVMNGLKIELDDVEGHQKMEKKLTLRSSARDEYWVFSANDAGVLKFISTVPTTLYAVELYSGDVQNELKAGQTPQPAGREFTMQIEGCTGTGTTISGLDGGTDYMYWVKAVNETFGEISRPSNKMLFTTTGTTGIGNTPAEKAGAVVAPGTGHVGITLGHDARVAIVSAGGAVVMNGMLGTGTHNVSLASGMYIVKINSAAHKIVVR